MQIVYNGTELAPAHLSLDAQRLVLDEIGRVVKDGSVERVEFRSERTGVVA